jgi:TolA-binding protein
MKINSASLAEASTLASQIEALQGQLDELNGKVADTTKQLVPLQSRFQSLIGGLSGGKGGKTVKCARKGSRFSPEQRAAISAGLKAKWAERKAAKAAATATDTAPAVPVTA